MKNLLAIFLLLSLYLQTLSVIAIENTNYNIKNINYEIKQQTKIQYPYKKVHKKFNVYLVNIKNNNKQPILISKDTNIEFINNEGIIYPSDSRREIYLQTRSRDIGKYWGITLPSAIIAGGVIGITFGIGIPAAIGIVILGGKPADNAAQINNNFAKEIYDAHALPLRMEPNILYQVRLLIPKKLNVSKIRFTNLAFANDYSKKLNIEISLQEKGDKVNEK